MVLLTLKNLRQKVQKMTLKIGFFGMYAKRWFSLQGDGMLIGYMRVSTTDQTHALQHDALLAAGVEPDAIYTDTMSGKRDDRPGLASCLKALREGDTLVCWKLDRLGRSTKHLINTVVDLNNRGVSFRVLTGTPIDTTTAGGKLQFAIFAGLAEFERALISERTKAGLEAARARGHKGGRKAAFTPAQLRMAAAAMAARDVNVSELAKQFGVTRVTIYKHVRPDGTLTDAGERVMASR
jgi:DNA invertase Pin-like site-specific DNA recombinase